VNKKDELASLLGGIIGDTSKPTTVSQRMARNIYMSEVLGIIAAMLGIASILVKVLSKKRDRPLLGRSG
jgi:hypothetical protein